MASLNVVCLSMDQASPLQKAQSKLRVRIENLVDVDGEIQLNENPASLIDSAVK